MKEDKILLAKRSKGLLEAGKWSLLGGFVNRDETVAEAGVREALEESGWTIDNLRLLCINDNPNRPHEDRQNIDFIYIADALNKIADNDWESEELQWLPLHALPPSHSIAFDHADNIELYKKYLKAPFPLPVTGKINV